jgi:hypothetical protein
MTDLVGPARIKRPCARRATSGGDLTCGGCFMKRRSISLASAGMLALTVCLIFATIGEVDAHDGGGTLQAPSGCRITSRPNEFKYSVSFVGINVLENGATAQALISETVERAIAELDETTELKFERSDSMRPSGPLVAVRVTPFSLRLPSEEASFVEWDLIGDLTSTGVDDIFVVLPPERTADMDLREELAATAGCRQVYLEPIGKIQCGIERFADRSKRLRAAIVYVGLDPITDMVERGLFDIIATPSYIATAVTRCLDQALGHWIGSIGIIKEPE